MSVGDNKAIKHEPKCFATLSAEFLQLEKLRKR